jgi:hypothetical protein
MFRGELSRFSAAERGDVVAGPNLLMDGVRKMEPLRVLLMVACLVVCGFCIRGVTSRYAISGVRGSLAVNLGLGLLAAVAWLGTMATLVLAL